MTALYTPKELRELADRQASPLSPHLMDEYRRALRWSANVIEAANELIRARSEVAPKTTEG